MHAMITPCTSKGDRSQELPYLSNIMQVIGGGLASLVNL